MHRLVAAPVPLPLFWVSRVSCLVLLMSLATACLPPRREVVAVSGVSEDELRSYAGTGPCAIRGQAFLKTRGGDVKYGAGELVTLMPDTALSERDSPDQLDAWRVRGSSNGRAPEVGVPEKANSGRWRR